MKRHYLLSVALISVAIFGLGNFHAEASTSGCDSVNEVLNAKFRFLGGWDQKGIPDYLEANIDTVSQELLDYVMVTIPEKVDVSAEYLSDTVQLNTELTDSSKVYLTFVHEGAKLKNTLGFYTYDINNPPATVEDIDSLVIIFPNVTQPQVVNPGTQVLLGEFPPNTGIGYFLIQGGWIGDTVCIPTYIFFTDSRFNPGGYQQSILLNYEAENKFLLSFEDLLRPGEVDEDFNDAVFFISTTPGTVDTTNIPKLPLAKLSGDTVLCNASDLATIKIELYGTAPWTIIYNNGTEDVKVEGITENVYTFETDIKDTFTLKSVEDAHALGIIKGKAVVSVLNPTASLIGESTTTICNGESAEINIGLDGTGPWNITYKIGDEEFTATSDENSFKFEVDEAAVVMLVAVEDAYCPGTVTGEVEVKNISVESAVIDGADLACSGEAVDLSVSDLKVSTVEWSSNGSGNISDVNSEDMNYTPGENESGVITFTATLSNECGSTTLTKEVEIIEELDASFVISPDKKLTNKVITFTPAVSDYDGYQWYFGDDNESSSTIATNEFEEGGSYEIELVVNKKGCENSSIQNIDVYSKDELFIPNAFNPFAINPENRVVKVYGNNISNDGFIFKIFNRWGKVLYQTTNFTEANTVGWDGVKERNDEDQALNVFSYICKGKFEEGDPFEISGTVTLVK